VPPSAKWFDTLFLMILENHGWSQIQETSFFSWFAQYGTIFSSWSAAAHPSGPNYRSLMSGNYWSFNEFDGVHRPNIGDQVDCYVNSFKNSPAERHNPFLDMHSKNRLPQAELSSFKGIYYFGMDDDNNAHSGSLETADANVTAAITLVQKEKANTDRYAFFLVFDEAYGLDWFTNHVFAAIAGPSVPRGNLVHSPLSHFNFARLLYDNWEIAFPQEAIPAGNAFAGQALWELK
jgi:hypothetical protein